MAQNMPVGNTCPTVRMKTMVMTQPGAPIILSMDKTPGSEAAGSPAIAAAPAVSGLVLIIESSGKDARALREQLDANKVSNPVRTVFSVAEAERYLKNEPPYTDRAHCPRPSILFIDAGLPRFDRSVLMRSLKNREEWRNVLIIALVKFEDVTASQRAYAFTADCVMVKPCSKDDVKDMLGRFPEYWALP